MNTRQEIVDHIEEINSRLVLALPKVAVEIEVYERKLANKDLTKSPTPCPQFNG